MIEVPTIIRMIEARRDACYRAAEEAGASACETEMALAYDELLADINAVMTSGFQTAVR
jgi:hypothetical protein